ADTDNLDAYQAYLKARELFIARSNLKESVRLFEHAVELDPKFARAWEGLAAAYAVIEGWGIRDRDYSALVEPAARRALALDSSLSMAWASLSLLEMRNRPVDWAKALDLADRAVKADSNNATALLWRSTSWINLGYFDKALADQQRCLDVDPAYLNCTRWMAQSLVSMGNEQAALNAFEDGVARGFNNNRAAAFVPVLVKRGDLLAARLLMASMKVPPNLAELLIASLQAPGPVPPNAKSLIDRVIADPDSEFTSQVGESLAYIWLGDFDRAGALDDPLNDNVDAWMPGQPGWRNSAGFKRKLNGLGVPAYWRKYGFPARCRAVGSSDFTCDQPGAGRTVKP
ncbi:MAG: hypothetical protein ABIO30_00415, partial [Thermomonas sp.]